MHRAIAALGLMGAAWAAAAADAPPDPADSMASTRWVVGASLSNGPIYFGQDQCGSKLHGLFALQWGKLRISNSGAGGLIGEGLAGGASADVYSSPDWRVRLGVRLDRGRRIAGDSQDRLSDLTRVRGTLRGRIAVTRSLGAQDSISFTTAPDLLGRDGGTLMQLGYYRRLPWLDEALATLGGEWSLSGSLAGGDERYMKSYFGILPGAKRLALYAPEGGLRNLSLGLGWRRGFGEKQQWVLFGGANLDRLLDSAAKAPFVQRPTTWHASVGLAYRH